jgi:hypothetical protein
MKRKVWTSKIILPDHFSIDKAITKIKKKCHDGHFRFVVYRDKTYPVCWGDCRTCGLRELLSLLKEINSSKKNK